jgi:hypothetical protein
VVESTRGVVGGSKSLLVFVYRTLTLSGNGENLSQIDVRPDFGPLRFHIAIQHFAEAVCGGLVVVLEEERLRDPKMCQ